MALSSVLLSAVRPFAPRLVPILVCALFIPLLLLLSASAAWFVWSSLSASWEVPLYLQYGCVSSPSWLTVLTWLSDGTPPYAYAQLPALVPQQQYHVSLDLLLPYTDSNVQLGNFMINLKVSTLSNKTLAYVRRPVRFPHRILANAHRMPQGNRFASQGWPFLPKSNQLPSHSSPLGKFCSWKINSGCQRRNWERRCLDFSGCRPRP